MIPKIDRERREKVLNKAEPPMGFVKDGAHGQYLYDKDVQRTFYFEIGQIVEIQKNDKWFKAEVELKKFGNGCVITFEGKEINESELLTAKILKGALL